MHTNESQVGSRRTAGDAIASHPRLPVGWLPLLAAILLSGRVQSTAQNATYLDLHPEGASHSVLTSVTEDAQGGYILIVDDTPQPIPPSQTITPEPDNNGAQPVPLPESYAALWSGSAESLTLLAGGDYLSRVNDISPTHQVGQSASHAVMWFGRPESELHLFPGPIGSAYGIDGNRQVGMVGLPSSHAVMWEGFRETVIDLHPAAARSSVAFDIRDGQQVGWIDWGNGSLATVWSGSAASAKTLHPGHEWTYSVARATSGNLQAGSVWANGEPQAAIWRNTASSFKNLNPDGAESSAINDAMKHWQVGWARVGGTRQAMLWRGTAKSAASLHGVLAADGYTNSVAHGLWTDGHIIKIAGSATTTNGSTHAILWTVTRPHPAVTPGRGEGRGQDRHDGHTPALCGNQTPAKTGSFAPRHHNPSAKSHANSLGVLIPEIRPPLITPSPTRATADCQSPKVVEATASPSELWPANDRMVTVSVRASATDNSSALHWKVCAISCNKPHAANDLEFVDHNTVQLRATRSNDREDRVYTVWVRAEDVAGNLSRPEAVLVTVPQDRSDNRR